MRVLLDECLPRPLVKSLPHHDVSTAPEMGWASVRNGRLLALAADAGFEAFITADQNLQYQQQLHRARLGVIVVVASTNRLRDLLPLMDKVEAALRTLKPGQVVLVPATTLG